LTRIFKDSMGVLERNGGSDIRGKIAN